MDTPVVATTLRQRRRRGGGADSAFSQCPRSTLTRRSGCSGAVAEIKRSGHSSSPDQPTLIARTSAARVHGDHGQIALVLDRRVPQLIHDRLQFLDLAAGVLAGSGVDAAWVSSARRRQQVSNTSTSSPRQLATVATQRRLR